MSGAARTLGWRTEPRPFQVSRQAELTRWLAIPLAALATAAAAQLSFPLPFTPVPFTLQPVVALGSGLLLGWRRAMLGQALYLLAGCAGLPVFAASPLLPPGAGRLLGPTGGYLLSYPLAVVVVGGVGRIRALGAPVRTALALTCGFLCVYAAGVLWLSAVTGLSLATAVELGVLPFAPLDAIKVLVATAVMRAWTRRRDYFPNTSRY